MSETEKRKRRACFTGHRPEKLRLDETAVRTILGNAIDAAIANGFVTFISGKTRSGEVRSEYYRVSAWHKAALWARDRLRRGQLVSVAGYLTQRTVRREEETLHCTEIVAEQFRALKPMGEAKDAPAQENASADGAA